MNIENAIDKIVETDTLHLHDAQKTAEIKKQIHYRMAKKCKFCAYGLFPRGMASKGECDKHNIVMDPSMVCDSFEME